MTDATTTTPAPRNPAAVRRLLRWACYAVVLFGSFFLTLYLTEPEVSRKPDVLDSKAGAELLAARKVPTYGDLDAAARGAGLRLSTRLKGNVDRTGRLDPQRVRAAGWLADSGGDASQLTVMAFVNGVYAGMAQTAGERPDVTRAFGLGFGAEKNVSFHLEFNCQAGQQPVIVGVGVSRQYAQLRTTPCP